MSEFENKAATGLANINQLYLGSTLILTAVLGEMQMHKQLKIKGSFQ